MGNKVQSNCRRTGYSVTVFLRRRKVGQGKVESELSALNQKVDVEAAMATAIGLVSGEAWQ